MKKKTYIAPALCLVVLHERLMVVGSEGGGNALTITPTDSDSPSSSYEDDDDPNASRHWGGMWDDDDF